MQIDFSVELGKDDPVLEIPWKSEDGSLYYVNLKSAPERISELPEMAQFPELKPFLLILNARDTPLLTAKCDAWFSRDLLPEEDIFNADCKLICYVDLIFVSQESRCSFNFHEQYAKEACAVLQNHPAEDCSTELVIRRCQYTSPALREEEATGERSLAAHAESGFCFTVYVSGFGNDELEARKRWAKGLQILQDVLVQSPGSGY